MNLHTPFYSCPAFSLSSHSALIFQPVYPSPSKAPPLFFNPLLQDSYHLSHQYFLRFHHFILLHISFCTDLSRMYTICVLYLGLYLPILVSCFELITLIYPSLCTYYRLSPLISQTHILSSLRPAHTHTSVCVIKSAGSQSLKHCLSGNSHSVLTLNLCSVCQTCAQNLSV